MAKSSSQADLRPLSQEELMFVVYKLPTVVISRRTDQYIKAYETLLGREPQLGVPKTRTSALPRTTSGNATASQASPVDFGLFQLPVDAHKSNKHSQKPVTRCAKIDITAAQRQQCCKCCSGFLYFLYNCLFLMTGSRCHMS